MTVRLVQDVIPETFTQEELEAWIKEEMVKAGAEVWAGNFRFGYVCALHAILIRIDVEVSKRRRDHGDRDRGE